MKKKILTKRICTLSTLIVLTVAFVDAQSQDFEKYKINSLYTDYKAMQLGDIVTILIVESTSGQQQSNANASSGSSLKANGSLSGNLTSVLPVLGASAGYESDVNGKAGAAQKDVLTGKLTAVVTQIDPNGNLQLQGQRELEVNGEKYILKVNGLARQKDITSDNIVFSYNLANVGITYKKAGISNKLGKPGWMAKWTSWLVIAGLTTAATLGVSAAN